ncbi:MAG: RNA methyltransferase [Pseudopedobacter saltans]|uniref:RNA methyltransferase n=1 Tax=Pseudopedobacter saltans TaxID=151895 RepID=A0A2W5FF93_9SPHI|nr:MAG: RNA methyltransferase [Pseudopedobacter saltans]
MTELPKELLESLEKRKDFSKDSFLKAHDENPIVSIRRNPSKCDSDTALFPEMEKMAWNPYGYYLKERPSFIFDPLLHAGCYYVQEASSMFLWEILRQNKIEKDAKVLDLCAAPGGKTTLLASYFEDGLVVGNEVIKTRASILVENASKWGTGNIVVSNNDPKQFSQLPGYFDVMLIDAPCSGSGLFRKEIEWREGWSESNVALCSQRQQRILADAYDALKQDGWLIYSTCSFSQEEDEDIVDWILDNFSVENIGLTLDASWGIEETLSEKHMGKSYRFYPGKARGEGFFVSVFKKKDQAGYPHITGNLEVPNKVEKEILDKWLDNPDEHFIYKNGDTFHALPKAFKEDITLLKNRLYLRKGGTELGTIKGKDLIPSTELALSGLCAENIHKYDVAIDDALQYLRKNDIERYEAMGNGWALISYKNKNLGWVKVLPNRINNYYPIEWRIRKQ